MFAAAGAHRIVAEDASRALTIASLRGIDSHGIALLPRILKRVQAGRCQLSVPASVDGGLDGRAVKTIDARFAPGQHACTAAARAAVETTSQFGLGMATVRNSTHFGAAAPYLLEVLSHGFAAMVGSNSTPSVVAFNAPFVNLGNNPFGFAAPVQGGPDLVFDFSCGVMSFGRLAKLRSSGGAVPSDAFIKPTRTPQNNPVYEISGNLEYAALPFGAYKGASVAMMIEVMSGLLSRGNFGMKCETVDGDGFRGPSHFVLAFDPKAFGVENLASDMAAYTAGIRQDVDNIRLPGDGAAKTEAERRSKGIPLTEELFEELRILSATLGVNELASEGCS